MKLMIENIKIALQSIRTNLLRTVLTIFIIAIGIAALVGIQTAIESIKSSISENFTSMGANTFNIRNKSSNVRIGKSGVKPKRYASISYAEAMRFKNEFPVITSISSWASSTASITYKSKKSDPNINVTGTDENYILTAGYKLSEGRNFTASEVKEGKHLALIGEEVKNNIFDNSSPLGKLISIGGNKYRVIGVLAAKGSSMSFGGDKSCLIPLTNARQYFGYPGQSFTISVLSEKSEMLNSTIGQAIAKMRVVRKLKPIEEDNFDIIRSDNLTQIMFENIKYVTIAALVIGIITLFGSAIGLMNIMLVSVTERTKEIGTRKALGATSKIIRWQFLIEAIVICQLGGIIGIVLGILIGNITSIVIGSSFITPWVWILSGVALCIVVGLISGFFPAAKAAKLDPIEALRYE
ncbi:MAG: ABC transporter permease [Flavobacteriales bacterium]|jgi:putative ABC transport system permease protein|nr:ABC transporter permease [Flavobacteriales bacterium]